MSGFSGTAFEPRDFGIAVGFGQVAGYERRSRIGHCTASVVGTDVWPGNSVFPWMTGATALSVVCANAADTAAGTGARSISVVGLDANFDTVTQIVATAGAVPVPLPVPLRALEVYAVVTAGSGEVNAGNISIVDTVGGTVRGLMLAGRGIAQQSQTTVPAGHTLQITSQVVTLESPGGGSSVTVSTWIRRDGVYRMPLSLAVTDTPYLQWGVPGLTLPERSEFGYRITRASNNNLSVVAGWNGVLRRNDSVGWRVG